MKRLTLFILTFYFGAALYAQTPQGIKYQAVVRDLAGGIIANKPVFFKISILNGSATGTVVYRENHTDKSTNAFGLVDLEIGKGASELGTFSAINWGSGSYFIKVEIFPSGASGWQEMGTMQLLSVPYALYAKDVENKNDADADPANEIQSLSVSGSSISLSKGGGTVAVPGDNWGTQVAKTNATLTGQGTEVNPLGVAGAEIKPVWTNILNKPAGFADDMDNVNDADTSVTNEIQTLSLTGNNLGISGGNAVVLPVSQGDNWGSQVVKTNTTLTGQGTEAAPLGVVSAEIQPDWAKVMNKPAGFADGVDNTADGDTSRTNEIQKLSISGTLLTLDKEGGTVTLPSSGGGDNWGTQVVTIDTTLTGQGTAASPLGVAGSVMAPSWARIRNVPEGFVDGTDNVDDADNSMTNEIQTLSLNGNTLGISGANTVILPVSPGDNWGTQAVLTDVTLSGNGTAATPLKIAPRGALSGQVLKFDGTTWAPGNDLSGTALPAGVAGNIQFNHAGAFGGDTALTWDNAGKRLGIGTKNPAATLHIYGTGTGRGNVLFRGEFNSSSPGDPPASGAGTRLMWYPGKAAFRTGSVSGGNWDKDSIGNHSFASGYNAIAKGNGSTALGEQARASGNYSVALGRSANAKGESSVAMGYANTASGDYSLAAGNSSTASGHYSYVLGNSSTASGVFSTALGRGTVARSYGETVAGIYNLDYTPLSDIMPKDSDRLFVIGNGKAVNMRSNALTVLKNGNVGIGTDTPASRLTVNGAISMESHTISNVADPVNQQDAATKAYADAIKEIIYNELLNAGLNAIVRDADGNSYKTIKIGTQVWMAENLKTTHFHDSTAIPLVTDNSLWESLTTPRYCWYNNDRETYGNTYGALYNWNTVNTGKLCPKGWHVPSDADWTILSTFLGGESTAGGKMKESGTTHWTSPNTGATNESGFSGLPGGDRNHDGLFRNIGNTGIWWSSTEYSASLVFFRNMDYDGSYLDRGEFIKEYGFSVRCVRDNASVTLPTAITDPITGITQTTASGGGNVISDGGATVTARGVCWSTAQNPTVAGSKTSDGTGTGSFNSSLTGLTANTKYYVRAYATNSAGTNYGSQVEFTTSPAIVPPSVTTNPVTGIAQTAATGGGNVTSGGGAEVTARGVCWSTSENPTTAGSKTSDGIDTGSFSSMLTGLTANTRYYVRAYATNSAGTGYGSQVEFITSPVVPPPVTTNLVTGITQTTAQSGAIITSDGGSAITARGVCWSTIQNPTIAGSKTSDGTGTGSFTSNLTGLTAGTHYYVRAYATNSAGTSYGSQYEFTTLPVIPLKPTVSTNPITDITPLTATGGGNVTSDGGAAVTAKGVCWNTAGNPTIADSKTSDGTGTGSYTSNLTGLTAGTQYYVRAYATNSEGTGYGLQVSFTSEIVNCGTISDIEGNTYKTVQIGTQCWMRENLKTTKYNDGTTIPNVTDKTQWLGLTTGAYCWYNNDIGNKAVYGGLYNWYAVTTYKLCPTGWHVPSSQEWKALSNHLGGENVAGGKMKETGTTHWQSPNTGATNESGFSGLPGGFRVDFFNDIGLYGDWWSSTQSVIPYASHWWLSYNNSSFGWDNHSENLGLSIRCVKGALPSVTTNPITQIYPTTATGGGNVTSQGDAGVTARGVCWNTSPYPTISDAKTTDETGTGSFTSRLAGLRLNTTYYVRAYATNSLGTAYGQLESFTADYSNCGTINDVDGNTYKTVQIGTQCWMRENLKTTKYNDGTAIPNVTDNTAWGALTTGALCWYNNDIGNKADYGALYNWYAVHAGKLCPAGWHAPSTTEWSTLVTFLGGVGNAGGKMKETGTAHWISPNTGATNESGFSALPGGSRAKAGNFYDNGGNGHWWSSTAYSVTFPETHAWGLNLYNLSAGVGNNTFEKQRGCSIRCVKD